MPSALRQPQHQTVIIFDWDDNSGMENGYDTTETAPERKTQNFSKFCCLPKACRAALLLLALCLFPAVDATQTKSQLKRKVVTPQSRASTLTSMMYSSNSATLSSWRQRYGLQTPLWG